MESMGRKKPRPLRSFSPEFKAEIVELCQRGDRSVAGSACCSTPMAPSLTLASCTRGWSTCARSSLTVLSGRLLAVTERSGTDDRSSPQ
jgi:hypothetical protein